MDERQSDVLTSTSLVCPSCGNLDPTDMTVAAETVTTGRYVYSHTEAVPVFRLVERAFYDEGADRPSLQCLVCDAWWSPDSSTFELD